MSMGMTLQKAALVMSIPKEEALEYAKKRLETKEETGLSLKLVAERALKDSLTKLQEIVKEPPRYGKGGTVVYNTDLDAAKFLARLSLDAIKLAAEHKAQKDEEVSAIDFWDQAGAWQLKKPGAD